MLERSTCVSELTANPDQMGDSSFLVSTLTSVSWQTQTANGQQITGSYVKFEPKSMNEQ